MIRLRTLTPYAGWVVIFSLLTGMMPQPSVLSQTISMTPDDDMNRILTTLKQHDFKVSFSRPPRSKAYGLIQTSTKQIWIHPITYQLGIAKQTLIHEAVHAAQSCQSADPVQPLGIDVPISPLARRHFLRYHNFRRHVEAEALTVQGLPNGTDYVIQLLQRHCSG